MESTLEFLEEAGFVDEPPGLDDQVLAVIDILQGADSVDQALLARLQDVLAASRDHLAGSATSGGRGVLTVRASVAVCPSTTS